LEWNSTAAWEGSYCVRGAACCVGVQRGDVRQGEGPQSEGQSAVDATTASETLTPKLTPCRIQNDLKILTERLSRINDSLARKVGLVLTLQKPYLSHPAAPETCVDSLISLADGCTGGCP